MKVLFRYRLTSRWTVWKPFDLLKDVNSKQQALIKLNEIFNEVNKTKGIEIYTCFVIKFKVSHEYQVHLSLSPWHLGINDESKFTSNVN